MPAPDLTTVTGTVYNAQGVAVAGATLTIKKVIKGGVVVSTNDVKVRANDSGVVSFSVLRDSTVYLEGPMEGFTRPNGVPVTIPNSATVTLESLIPIVSVPSAAIETERLARIAGDVATLAAANEYTDEALADIDLSAYQLRSEENQANGYAGLDGSGLIPDNRIPSSIARDSEVTSAVNAEAATRAAADTALTDALALINTELDLLDTEVDGLDADLDAHTSATAAHGATGAVVGTTNTQTITNKTLTSPVINSPTGITKGDVGLGNVDNTSDANKPVSAATQTALDGKANTSHTHTLSQITDAGTAASKNTGTTNGTVPLIGAGDKLSASLLPNVAINDTFVVASQAAMLALTAERGDVAVRTDLSKSFILTTDDPTVLANWQELLTPADVVQSVAGKTGTVTLDKADVGLGNVDNTSDATKNAATATLTNKTLTSPRVGTAILDTNGNEVIAITATGSAVNEFTVTNAATGGKPKLSATGGDTNIGMEFTPKGTGGWTFKAGSSTVLFEVLDSSNNVFFKVDQAGSFTGIRSNFGDALTSGGLFQVVTGSGRIIVGPSGTLERRASSGGAIDALVNFPKAGVVGLEAGSAAGGTLRATPTTPSQITSDQNNYNPGGVSLYQRWSSDASRIVTGLSVSQVAGEAHQITNVGSNNIVLAHESASSTAANRFTSNTGADITLGANDSALVWYDGTSSRWRAFKLLKGDDTAYGAGWNGSLAAPTQNALYDKIESMGGGSSILVMSPNASLSPEGIGNTAPGYDGLAANVFVAPHAFTINKMKVRINATQGDDSLILRIQKNGSTVSTHTIPTGSLAGSYSFSPGISFAEDDTFIIQIENAATDLSQTILSVSLSIS